MNSKAANGHGQTDRTVRDEASGEEGKEGTSQEIGRNKNNVVQFDQLDLPYYSYFSRGAPSCPGGMTPEFAPPPVAPSVQPHVQNSG